MTKKLRLSREYGTVRRRSGLYGGGRAWRCAFIAALAAALAMLSGCQAEAAPDIAAQVPATPAPTPHPTAEVTPAPQGSAPPARSEWLLSFAGDCTIGTLHEWQGKEQPYNMLYVMGDDLTYPLSNVAAYFQADDLTIVNCEGTFTNETTPKRKDFRFRSSPEYAEAFTLGGVDAVSLANNHAVDYLEQGGVDTRSALDAQGILWTDSATPIITVLEDGPKIGVISFCTVEIDLVPGDVDGFMARIEPVYQTCVEQGCDIIIAFNHWGWENQYTPVKWVTEFAHRLADMGCDLVIGAHAHVLQPLEVYNGVPIYYGLGNFCFGGCTNPDDKDTVIVQQSVIRLEDGSFTLGQASYVPCRIGSIPAPNDFCPTPYPPDSEGYARVLKKLGVAP